MRKKMTSVNIIIFLLSLATNIFSLNYFLVNSYSQNYIFLRVNVVVIGLYILYMLYMLSFSYGKIKSKDILKIAKEDVNNKLIETFAIFIVLAYVVTFLVLKSKIESYIDYIVELALSFISVLVVFYLLYFLLPKGENLSRKIHRLKRKSPTLKYVLIEGKDISSSFDTNKNYEYEVSKDIMYINSKDLERIKDKSIREYIEKNTVAIIYEIDTFDENEIIQKYEKEEKDRICYYIFAIKNYDSKMIVNSSKKLSRNKAICLCDEKDAVEFCENLFLVAEKENVKKIEYLKAKWKIDRLDIERINSKEAEKEKYITYLDTLCKYNFNNRILNRDKDIPKDKMLFSLYSNTYLETSAYQAVLSMYSYITAIGRVVQYYLYAKYNPKFDKEKIDRGIIRDNPTVWANQILVSILDNGKDVLYKNLREKKFELTHFEKILVKVYLSNILNEQIEGDSITFDGIVSLFVSFRNKVEAHGVLSDANIYAVWNLAEFFANKFSLMFMAQDIKFEIDGKNVNVCFREDKRNVGNYIIAKDNSIYYINGTKSYIDYYSGDKVQI